MSWLTFDCKPSCWANVTCSTCGRTKIPVGRSAPVEMAGSMCDWDCPGYTDEPRAGHLWPSEAPSTDEVRP